jgi:MFS family permease
VVPPAPASDDRAWLRVAPAVFVLAWGGNQFTPLLSMYRDLEGYSAATVNLFLATYVVGLVPGFQVVGPLLQRYGAIRCTYAALVLSATSSLLLALGSGSPVALACGRLLVGASVAVAMVVGTSWIEQLTPDGPGTTRAARRTATTLTLGFGLGAGVAGVLSQWAPAPRQLPYAVHLALVALAAVVLRGAPGTPRSAGRLRIDIHLPRRARRRFLLVVLPTAPWVFASAGLAYAIVPELVHDRTAELGIAFATLLTVLTLGSGAVAQPWVARLSRVTGGREALVGIGLMTVGVGLAAVEAHARSLVLAVVVAITLGTAYGITIVAGLVEVRTTARAEGLPGLTGVYYALTYVGFALPAVLAALRPLADYPRSLALVALACAASTALTAHGLRTTRRQDVAAGSLPASAGKSS